LVLWLGVAQVTGAARAQSELPPRPRDLSGAWSVADTRSGGLPRQTVRLEAQDRDEASWVAGFVGDGSCPAGSQEIPHYFVGTLTGDVLEGTIQLCPSQGYIDLCGSDAPYSVGFRATVLAPGTIEGNYTTEGASKRGEAGCRRDPEYDSHHTFRLAREGWCDDADWLESDECELAKIEMACRTTARDKLVSELATLDDPEQTCRASGTSEGYQRCESIKRRLLPDAQRAIETVAERADDLDNCSVR
jgi:hypothetical protein